MRHMTRRSAALLSASALAWIAARRGLGAALRDEPYTVAGGTRPLLAHPLTVPRDFVGMHAHRWPVDSAAAHPSPSAAPSYGFGSARSHDHEGTSWNQIHLAPNHFVWDSLDRWVAAHTAQKRTLIYTLYGTPAWAAERTDKADLYGHPGGAAPPRDPAALAAFLRALTLRYNGNGRRRIHFVETWNEPHFEGESRDFWWGSAEQMVGVARTVSLSAKSVDPGVRVLSPGFVGDLSGALLLRLPALAAARRSSMYQFLTASDGHGGVGSRWCDGIAFHTYNAPLEGKNIACVDDLLRVGKMLGMMGIALPLYNTECGFIAPHPFRAMSPAQQAVHLKRFAALQAAMGVQGLYFYSHDDDFVGNPAAHPQVASAIDDLQRSLAGATLHQVAVDSNGAVNLVTDGGAFTW